MHFFLIMHMLVKKSSNLIMIIVGLHLKNDSSFSCFVFLKHLIYMNAG